MPEVDPVFEDYRNVLSRLAYRMLGSQSDADDVMQEAYLKWTKASRESVKSPRAYLHSIVTNLCIDQRKTIDERNRLMSARGFPSRSWRPVHPRLRTGSKRLNRFRWHFC